MVWYSLHSFFFVLFSCLPSEMKSTTYNVLLVVDRKKTIHTGTVLYTELLIFRLYNDSQVRNSDHIFGKKNKKNDANRTTTTDDRRRLVGSFLFGEQRLTNPFLSFTFSLSFRWFIYFVPFSHCTIRKSSQNDFVS